MGQSWVSPQSKHLSWGENLLLSTTQGPPWVLLRTFHQFFLPGLPSSHGAGPHPSLPLLLPPLPAQFPEEVYSNPHPSTQADQTLPSLPLLSPGTGFHAHTGPTLRMDYHHITHGHVPPD